MVATINVAAFLKDTDVVGPGTRDALWVQGCSIGCHGCANSVFQPHEQRRLLTVDTFLNHFRHRRGVINGISVLGGEPTEQAASVARLLEGVQELGLTTVVFTGRIYEELLKVPDSFIQRLLAATDLLIDGPFIQSQCDPSLRWRGSRNQRLIYLTPRLQPCEDMKQNVVAEVLIYRYLVLINGVLPDLLTQRQSEINS